VLQMFLCQKSRLEPSVAARTCNPSDDLPLCVSLCPRHVRLSPSVSLPLSLSSTVWQSLPRPCVYVSRSLCLSLSLALGNRHGRRKTEDREEDTHSRRRRPFINGGWLSCACLHLFTSLSLLLYSRLQLSFSPLRRMYV